MFLGTTADGLYEVKCPTGLSTSSDSRVRFHDAADGSRSATVFGDMIAARVWQVSYGALTPGAADLLDALSTNPAWYARGAGIVFVPSGGEKVNLLTREETTLTNARGYVASLSVTEDGPTLGYVLTGRDPAPTTGVIPLPVTGLRDFTASVYLTGSGIIEARWVGANGQTIESQREVIRGGKDGILTRAHVHFEDYPLAVGVVLAVQGQFTRPALTLGTTLWAWGDGQRVGSVIVEQDNSELLWAGSNHRARATYTRASYRITELREGRRL